MKREDLSELHYIAPIENVPSIYRLGILSHRKASKIEHKSIAMKEIQDRRKEVGLPSGKNLHDYANLYICARNPMLYKRLKIHQDLCILRISTKILDIPDVVISDGNASSNWARFAAAPEGLRIIDHGLTFAHYWTDPDIIQGFKKKSAKCAEVLVPNCIEPKFILGAYVSCEKALARFYDMNIPVPVSINASLFFL